MSLNQAKMDAGLYQVYSDGAEIINYKDFLITSLTRNDNWRLPSNFWIVKYFTIGVILLLLSCNSAFNNNDREKLVFKDKASNIQHALIEISNLIRKIPSNTNGFNTTYGFFDNQLEINKISERSADSTHIITLQALESLTTSQKIRFVKLATYLNDNNLSSGYLDQELNRCVFLYHSSRNISFDNLREVIIVNEDSVKLLYKDYKILDHDGMLYLIAPLRE